tara:strand:+ start:5964 stop:6347 length:384 start_codon:yes stop_codon:yes gene_type:complete
MSEDVLEVDLAKEAGIQTEEEKTKSIPEVQGLITFDQLVMNFLQQHATAKEEYIKLQQALDNMHYTSTITKISLQELQTKKDLLNKLSGAVEALALYKKHVDPNCTEREFEFTDDEPEVAKVNGEAD